MSKRIPRLFIIDMLECVNNIIQYTSNMTYESFLADSKTKDAVIRNIEVLGEAAKRVPEPIKTKYPEVEWGKITRSRHIVAHEYFDVDYTIYPENNHRSSSSIKGISSKDQSRT